MYAGTLEPLKLLAESENKNANVLTLDTIESIDIFWELHDVYTGGQIFTSRLVIFFYQPPGGFLMSEAQESIYLFLFKF